MRLRLQPVGEVPMPVKVRATGDHSLGRLPVTFLPNAETTMTTRHKNARRRAYRRRLEAETRPEYESTSAGWHLTLCVEAQKWLATAWGVGSAWVSRMCSGDPAVGRYLERIGKLFDHPRADPMPLAVAPLTYAISRHVEGRTVDELFAARDAILRAAYLAGPEADFARAELQRIHEQGGDVTDAQEQLDEHLIHLSAQFLIAAGISFEISRLLSRAH